MKKLLRRHFRVFGNTAIIIISLLYLSGCKSDSSALQSDHKDDSTVTGANVLTELQLADNSSVQLYLAPCASNVCPIQLRLVRNGRVLATDSLDWSASSRKLHEASWTGPWHTGTGESLPVYVLGEENRQIGTSMEIVQMSTDANAVFIRQSGGFEHVKQRYDLYAVKDNKFVRLWSDIEGEGPVNSDAAVVNKGSVQDILYIKGLATSYLDHLDVFDYPQVERLHWSAESSSLKQEIAHGLAVVQVVHEFSSIDAARRFLVQKPLCLDYYWVINGGAVSGLPKGKPVIVAIMVDKTGAEQELIRLHECNPDLEVRLTTISTLEQE